VGAFAFAEASSLVSGLWMGLVFRAAGLPPEPWAWPVLNPAWIVQELLAYSGVVAAAHLLLFYDRYRRQEAAAADAARQRALLEASLKQAELDALRAQINPHFLFNTLQSVSLLMQEDVPAANRMLLLLADLLRDGAVRDHPLEVTLERELDLVRRYLEIERIRFGDRLQVRYDIPPDTRDALVPSLLLQPSSRTRSCTASRRPRTRWSSASGAAAPRASSSSGCPTPVRARARAKGRGWDW